MQRRLGQRIGFALLSLTLALAAPLASYAGSTSTDPFQMAGPAGSTNLPAGQKFTTDLTQQLASLGPTDSVYVLTELTADPATDNLAALKTAVGAFTPKYVWSDAIYGFAATLTKTQILALAARPDVVMIQPSRPIYKLLDTATKYTGVQQARADFGVDGSGVNIAIIDTGIDAQHADFQGRIAGWMDLSGDNKAEPEDCDGHGSHVSGIAAGTGRSSNGQFAGVAPGAKLVAVRVFPCSNPLAEDAAVVNAINWVVKNAKSYNIRVANMSLGDIFPCSDGQSLTSKATDNAVKKGIVMAIAAGNAGPGPCTVSAPGDAKLAITAGNGVDPGPSNSSKRGWTLSISSSRGPTADGRVKPDVVAPGTAITSVAAGTGNQYTSLSGTSMASPFVAGVAALLISAKPGLTPGEVKQLITSNANPWGPAQPNNEYGWGMINPYKALQAIKGQRKGFDGFGIQHRFVSGQISGTPSWASHVITVTDTGVPIGVTMVISSWQGTVYYSLNGVRVSEGTPNFDLELYDPAGNLVVLSPCAAQFGCTATTLAGNTERQEQIRYLPKTTGDYTLKVVSRLGGGSYFADFSYK